MRVHGAGSSTRRRQLFLALFVLLVFAYLSISRISTWSSGVVVVDPSEEYARVAQEEKHAEKTPPKKSLGSLTSGASWLRERKSEEEKDIENAILPTPVVTEIDLAGMWELIRRTPFDHETSSDEPWEGKSYGNIARVPGYVQQSLLKHQKLPDLHVGWNLDSNRRAIDADWTYRKRWHLDDVSGCDPHTSTTGKSLSASVDRQHACRLFIVCDGMDTFFNITLNGVLVAQEDFLTANQWARFVYDVSDIAMLGDENILHVDFLSPVAATKEAVDYYAPRHYWHVPQKDGDSGWNLVRKAPTHYGWDWGPSFLPTGIWKPIYFVAVAGARITDITTRIAWLGDPTEGCHFVATVYMQGTVGARGRVKVSLAETPASASASAISGSESFFLVKEEEHKVEIMLTVQSAKLWWPRGYGEQPLYDLTVELTVDSQSSPDGVATPVVVDTKQKKIGFRTVNLVRKDDLEDNPLPGVPEAKKGRSFYVEVNGKRVFMKGMNWIPADLYDIHAREGSWPSVKKLLEAAIAVNANTIRVWGGGVYESEEFYQFCDENGLMVWQDMMYSVSTYPAEEEFLKNVEKETIHQARRLNCHPSLVVWCGNNEIEWMWTLGEGGWGPMGEEEVRKDIAKLVEEYHVLFRNVIPVALVKEDRVRPYTHSSPTNGCKDLHCGYANQFELGDVHWWDPWFAPDVFYESYRTVHPRFASEFGFQSFPSYETLLSVAPSADDLSVESDWMKYRQKAQVGNDKIVAAVEWLFPNRGVDFKDMIYLSQLYQAINLKVAVEHWRRLTPYCSGTIYWQLNDLYVAPTWSSIERGGRWKMSHYFARGFFSPVLVSTEEREGKLKVWLTTDGHLSESLKGRVDLKVWDLKGRSVTTEKIEVEMAPTTQSHVVYESPIASVLGGHENVEVFATVAFVGEGGNQESSNIHFFSKFKDMKGSSLTKAVLTTDSFKCDADALQCSVQISSSSTALMVHFESLVEGYFESSPFVLLPGQSVVVSFVVNELKTWGGKEIAPSDLTRQFQATMSVTSLCDHLGDFCTGS